MSDFPAVAHVAVTVSDLDRSRPWYNALFGSEPVLDEDTGPFHHVVWLLGGTLFGIHQHQSPQDGSYTELQPGLDHVAFGLANRSELEGWEQKLNEKGIANGG